MLHRFATYLLFGLLALTSQLTFAHSKTDIVTFYNGDRITGEVKSLFAGYLSVKTDSMGTVKIEWQELSKIESRFNYEVRLSNGQRHFGTLNPGKRPGTLVVAVNEAERQFEWLEVVELRQIEATWVERIKADISLGYSYTQATSTANSEVKVNLSYEDEDSINSLGGRYTVSDTDTDLARSSRVDLTRRTWSPRREEIFRDIYGSYETNDQLGLEGRYLGGLGIGQYFIDTHGKRLSGLVGIQVVSEDTFDTINNESKSSDESIEAALQFEYSAWRLSTPELFLDTSAAILPSITDSGRVRAQADISLKWELVEDLFWEVSGWGTYDNEADAEQQYDYGISTGVGWTY